VHKLYPTDSNQSVDNISNAGPKQEGSFFNKRVTNRYKKFNDTKIRDILTKIENKKQDIMNIEQKYFKPQNSAYKCKAQPDYRTKAGIGFGYLSQGNSPNLSKYPPKQSRNERYVSRNQTIGTSIAKVIPSQIIEEKLKPSFSRNSKYKQRNTKDIPDIKTKIKNKPAGNKQNRNYLNSWERENLPMNEDIKEEYSNNYDSALERNTPREEGSAARRLLESMSKFAEYEKYDSENDVSDDFNEKSANNINMIRQVQQRSRLGIGNRPYSPPFSKISGKSK
jgi:hypothetical protein